MHINCYGFKIIILITEHVERRLPLVDTALKN